MADKGTPRGRAARATGDQALGVLLAVYRFTPTIGFEALREVSQRTNTELRVITRNVIDWALGAPLPEVVGRELDSAVERAWRAAEEYRID
ncbi:ANTAR domain-containing protein [Streptomyces sp. NPDC057837]|uniref:ANTAR domain-containing protein n=1 Tax=Streptomyces sp. NPDC057837 TaxID=3346260 RepID=UPI00369F8DA2